MTQEVIMKKLAGKSALITGGASGIGRATALLFAQEGAAVALADLNEQGAQDAAGLIESAGGKAIYIRCDVRSASDCQVAVRTVVETFGGLDILFNNAGAIRRADVVGTSEEERPGSLGNRKTCFCWKPPNARSGATPGRKRSPMRCCTWPATRPAL
jgi:short-subunit dehydrogenase involved in D-alanine esterification of teichoic acids